MTSNPTISAELMFIISQLPYSYRNKIPTEVINELQCFYSSAIYNSFDVNKPFTEQNISDEALTIFNDYIDEYFI